MLTYPNQHAVSTRDLAWNTAGEALTDSAMTASEALSLGGLANWNVRKVPLVTSWDDTLRDYPSLPVPGRYATLADIGGVATVLGVVGERYRIFQNEEKTALLDTIVDDSGANYVAAGKLRKNKRTFVVLKMPEGVTIGGEDATDLFLLATNTHDGSGALRLGAVAVQLTCTNMIPSAFGGAKSSWTLRHTSNMDGKVQQARDSLKLAFHWVDAFQREAEEFLSSPFSENDFERLLDYTAPVSESEHDGWVKRQADKRDTLRWLFNEAETNALGRGTKWGAYSAFTEYADWYMPVKGTDAAGVKRATRTLDSSAVDGFKQNAHDALVAA